MKAIYRFCAKSLEIHSDTIREKSIAPMHRVADLKASSEHKNGAPSEKPKGAPRFLSQDLFIAGI